MTTTDPSTPDTSSVTELADVSETLFESFDDGYYIGMMSGTSLDGLDAVICQFSDSSYSTASGDNTNPREGRATNSRNKIVASHSKAFPDSLRLVLLALCQPDTTSQLTTLNKQFISDYPNLQQWPQSELEWFGWASRAYAEFASNVVDELLAQSDLNDTDILAIGCHGQTVRHCPQLGFSLQLVDPNIIAERTGISVVSDFRRRDMAVGGQGAPLAPAFHLAQFATISNTNANANANDQDNTDTHRIVVNLGGIANISVLPAKQTDKVIGYDTGPANILLDAWYHTHVDALNVQNYGNNSADTPQFEPLFDKDGQWAQTGQVNDALLKQLMSHPYFAQPTPKSTGREDFHLDWLTEQIKWLDDANTTLQPEDVQATLCAFTAQTLADAIQAESARLDMTGGDIIVCGGGAHNPYLLQQIAQRLPQWQVVTSAELGIAPTWVEAMAFAWLARQTIMGQTGNLPTVTGAQKSVVLGQVCFA